MSDLIKRLQFVLDNTHDHDAFALARDCKAEIERLSKPYVPIKAHEHVTVGGKHYYFTMDENDTLMQQAVIERAGLEVAK